MIKTKQIKKVEVKTNKVLKSVLVCSPDFFKIIKPINYTEKETFKEGIKLLKLKKEHSEFCDLLTKWSVKPIFAPLQKDCPQQTFTRDIGFVVNNWLFVCKSTIEMRKNEIKIFDLLFHNYKNIYYFENHIEGGDVIVKDNNIFVGLSSRTKIEAVYELKSVLPKVYNVIVIKLKKKILHLDTVFNFVNETAVFFEHGVKDKNFDINKYFKSIIYIEKTQQKFLPTNFLPLNIKTIIASKKNVVVNKKIEEKGITVIQGSFDEMLKLGGSYRCCSLEILKNWEDLS